MCVISLFSHYFVFRSLEYNIMVSEQISPYLMIMSHLLSEETHSTIVDSVGTTSTGTLDGSPEYHIHIWCRLLQEINSG